MTQFLMTSWWAQHAEIYVQAYGDQSIRVTAFDML